MMKRVDTAAYDACKAVADGTFKGGIYTYSLANNGVGLPDENPNLSEEVLNTVEEYKQKVLDGEITVSDTPVTNADNPNTSFTGATSQE